MIDGVTILNEYTKTPAIAAVIIEIVVIVLLLIFVNVMTVVGMGSIKEMNWLSWLFCSILTFVAFSGIALVVISYKAATPYTWYEVTVDDSVSFNEFHEKYRIISKENGVYTIEIIPNDSDTVHA